MELGACPHCLRLVQLSTRLPEAFRVRCPYCAADALAGTLRSLSPKKVILLDEPPSEANTGATIRSRWEEVEAAVAHPNERQWSFADASPGKNTLANPSVANDAAALAIAQGIQSQGRESHANAPTQGANSTYGPRLPLGNADFKSRKHSKANSFWSVMAPAIAAPVGLALGYAIVLWLKGPEGDFLGVLTQIERWTSEKSAAEKAPTMSRSAHAPNKGGAATNSRISASKNPSSNSQDANNQQEEQSQGKVKPSFSDTPTAVPASTIAPSAVNAVEPEPKDADPKGGPAEFRDSSSKERNQKEETVLPGRPTSEDQNRGKGP